MKGLLVAAGLALAATGCARGGDQASSTQAGAGAAEAGARTEVLPLTITGPGGRHTFQVELAKTPAAQEQGLMYRTDLKPDGGMLFWPYPATGGPPSEANFWMKNTPTPLDIAFIRADGTIAHIAENTVPFSEAPVPSGEPVSAVLELVGGRTAELGIAEGDRVTWSGRK